MILREVIALVCNLVYSQICPKSKKSKDSKISKNSNFEKIPTTKSLRT